MTLPGLPGREDVVQIPLLPLIDRAALAGLPDDMEGRLLVPANGAVPSIVLYHPASELHLEVSLLSMADLAPFIERIRGAVLKQGMGEPPAGEGYSE